MANNRIFYAVQAVGIGATPVPSGSIATEGSGFRWMKGVQSVGITTNFNLEQAFELGQLALYQNIENVPEIEVTIEKVIDGRHLLYLQSAGQTATGNIVSAAAQRCDVWLAIYSDTNSAASGASLETLVYCSGMRVNNATYTFPVDGNSTESVTLVGNDKLWYAGSAYGDTINTGFAQILNTPHAPNLNIARRQHFKSGSSTIPGKVANAIRGGVGNIQNITIACDFNRDNIFELGSFRPYYKYARFPVTVTCDFEVMSISGDKVQASGDAPNQSANGESIKVVFDVNSDSASSGQLEIDLGSRNKLTSVNYTGGGTDGGNATVRYSYQTFNAFLVKDDFCGNGSNDGAAGQYWETSLY